MNIPQELLYQQYVRRELETYRAPYDPEPEFYSYVRQGNTEKVKELCRESFQEKKGLGILSDSPLQNLKYHFATCERPDLAGVTSHALDIFQK